DAGPAERRPGESDARRQVVVVGIGHHIAKGTPSAIACRLGIPMVEQARERVLENLGANAGLVGSEVESLVPVQLVLEQTVRLIADAEIQREIVTNAPGVARVPSGLGTPTLLVLTAVLGEEGEAAEHEVGAVETFVVSEGGNMAIELELAGTVESRVVVETLASQAHSPHQGVVALGHTPIMLEFEAAAAESNRVQRGAE